MGLNDYSKTESLNHFNLMAGTSGPGSMNILIGQSAAAVTTLQCYHARDVKRQS